MIFHHHFITGQELSVSQLQHLLLLAKQQKQHPQDYQQVLAGKSIVTVFEKPSLRTRMSFEVGMQRLGGQTVILDETKQPLGARESLADYAQNLSCWCHAIVARVRDHATLETLANYASVPVINSLCDRFHPCQALADCLTLQERFGNLAELHIVYSGDGNNVARSLMLYAAMLGAKVTVVTPPSRAIEASWLEMINSHYEGQAANVDNLADLGQADVIYTDTWVSMGDSMTLAQASELFFPYQVNQALVERLQAKAVMHCQPAHRGYEITTEVMDGELSLCMQQAENRLFAQNALLTQLLSSSHSTLLRNAS